MTKTSEFYVRFIESCFARAASSSLPLAKIKREARMIFTPVEIEEGLIPALQKLADRKFIEIRDPDESVCLLEHRPVNMDC